MLATHAAGASPGSRAKRCTFCLLAVLLGLTPLLLAETVCRFAGWGYISEREDPYVGFSDIHPLFAINSAGDRYETASSRLAYFRPESFAAHKAHDEFRVFCLGGSTVQGRPYAIETSFTSWLELSLRAADPGRTWEVVNCGGVSYASYRLAPILDELLQYEPDLFIIYTGHNEFLEDRTYTEVKQAPAAVTRAHGWCSRLRVYNICRSAWLELNGGRHGGPGGLPRSELPAEVDALLDYRGGLEDYDRDDRWQRGTVDHFRFNLLRIVRTARNAGVPVILVDPVANLKDCPPFKYANREDLSPAEHAEFQRLWQQARQEQRPADRIALLEKAIDIDDRHAGAQYLLGISYQAARQPQRARQALIRAKDEDICPLRMIEPLHDALTDVAAEASVPLVDLRGLFTERSPAGIPGEEWMLDHVHPSINGHKLIANALLDEVVQQGIVSLPADFASRQRQLYDEHLATLDGIYFARGKQRLEGLIRWTQGRASKLKPEHGSTPDVTPETE